MSLAPQLLQLVPLDLEHAHGVALLPLRLLQGPGVVRLHDRQPGLGGPQRGGGLAELLPNSIQLRLEVLPALLQRAEQPPLASDALPCMSHGAAPVVQHLPLHVGLCGQAPADLHKPTAPLLGAILRRRRELVDLLLTCRRLVCHQLDLLFCRVEGLLPLRVAPDGGEQLLGQLAEHDPAALAVVPDSAGERGPGQHAAVRHRAAAPVAQAVCRDGTATGLVCLKQRRTCSRQKRCRRVLEGVAQVCLASLPDGAPAASEAPPRGRRED
mmetsp:Transcript_19960/g.55316  ORF Transcript_19960/g.55316 Transcript_19960/m.55316 type:complete len:269 (-) Transcript_19960:694-1500(-)